MKHLKNLFGPLMRKLRSRPHQIAYMRLAIGRTVFWGGAVAVGLLAVLFAKMADGASEMFEHVREIAPWSPLVLAPAIGALCVALTRKFFRGAEGSGIPQALAEMQRPKGRWRPLLSLRIAFGKIAIGTLAMFGGFSLGREGPTVQVGASIMSVIHGWLPQSLGIQRNHVLVAGGAAGIAAAFNTPLAGILFAIEEMTRRVESRMSGLVITAIVLAGVVAKVFMGGGHYYGHVLIEGTGRDLFYATLVATLCSGLAGGLFARILILGATSWTGRIADFRKARPVAFGALCGLFIAILGMSVGGATFGSGYQQTVGLLHGTVDMPWYFGPFKFVATIVAYLSGLPGGIFAPSLAIGAGFGDVMGQLWASPDAHTMMMALCMAGFLAAVTQAPITSFVIVMEMVDGYSMVIALMATAFLASALSRLISPPLYHTLAGLQFKAASADESPQPVLMLPAPASEAAKAEPITRV